MKKKWVVLGNQEEKKAKRPPKNTIPEFHHERDFSCRLNSLIKTRSSNKKALDKELDYSKLNFVSLILVLFPWLLC